MGFRVQEQLDWHESLALIKYISVEVIVLRKVFYYRTRRHYALVTITHCALTLPTTAKMSLQASALGLAALLTLVSSAAVDDGCNALASSYPDRTFFPGSERYKFENECKIDTSGE